MKEELLIKVCGMRDPENLEQICSLGPDLVGFIFYPGSPRYVGDRPDPALFGIPKPAVLKAGVFVNEDEPEVRRLFYSLGLNLVQLHGEESPAYCRSLAGDGIPVIRSLSPGKKSAPGREPEIYAPWVRCFLMDTPTERFGGSGSKFDWKLLKDYRAEVPFLLSGGIGPGDAPELRGLQYRWLAGVDINSRFELSPGIKDVAGVAEFIRQIRQSDEVSGGS